MRRKKDDRDVVARDYPLGRFDTVDARPQIYIHEYKIERAWLSGNDRDRVLSGRDVNDRVSGRLYLQPFGVSALEYVLDRCGGSREATVDKLHRIADAFAGRVEISVDVD